MASPDPVDSTPPWLEEPPPVRYAPVLRDVRVDVAVIGGGITGVTAAYLIKRAGKTVALLDRRHAGGGETGHTTSHLTAVTDEPLLDLIDQIGPDHAQAVWDAGFAAIAQIHEHIARERLDCEFEWVPGFLFAPADVERDQARLDLGRVAEAARNLGFDATYLDEVPIFGQPGVQFDGQARLHPIRYLAGLLQRIPGDGSYVFEDSEVERIEEDPLTLHVGGNTIRADYLIAATHVPFMSGLGTLRATLLQTDLFLYSTYAIGGRLARGTLPEGLYWDTSDGYDYLRVDELDDHQRVIFGGEDHKTGQASDTRGCFEALERRLRRIAPAIEITHRWSGQVVETRDGLPYIGEVAPGRFAATGFAGNGMTFGTLAGMMAADAVMGRANPWRALFDVNRTHLLTGAWDYLKENSDYPYYMIRDRFAGPEGRSLREVARGQGKILRIDGRDVAVYRDEAGAIVRLSPICTHMGCKVSWNTAERTWDCPCHGSRFTPDGQVLAGPAERALAATDEKADSAVSLDFRE